MFMFVDDVEPPALAPIYGLIFHKIVAPYIVFKLGPKPDALHPFGIDPYSLVPKHILHYPVADSSEIRCHVDN